MKRLYLCFLTLFIGLNASYAQVDVPYVGGAGPLGAGSWLRFLSGGSATAIQENWGLNLTGTNIQPVKIYNSSLLVGYVTDGSTSFGVGNAFISGNVGIGTTANLNGVLNVTIPAAKTTTATPWNNSNNAAFFQTNDAAHPFALRVQIIGDPAMNNRFASLQTTDIGLVDGGNLVLQPANGNVGIGTESPVSLFQVDDGCTKASIGDASGSSALNWGTSYIGFNASRSGTGSTSSWLTSGDGGSNGGGVMYSSIFGDMYFATIPTTGGSGQTLADANIANNIALKISHTDGAVYAKKIYVQLTGFPDYVFNRDYQLMPLAQVKSYIDQNHHLPEMPTDKEVEAKGLDVGEMNKLLTKKVEELTLYMIELKQDKDKKASEQQDEINKLKKQLEELSLSFQNSKKTTTTN